MVIAITVVAPFVGPRLPLADANERYDLREHVTPPWDPLSVPSPLVELKSSLVDQHRTDVVFHVDADEPLARWQAAVLGSYDGVVWTVGSGQSNATSEFKQVGLRLPAPSTAEAGDAESVDATVTVRDLRAPWVPSPGWPTALDPLTAVTGDVRSNLRTGTVAVTGGMPADFSYNVSARPLSTADDDTLSTAHITSLPPSAQLDALPPAMRNLGRRHRPGQAVRLAAGDGDPRRAAQRGLLRRQPGVAPGHSYFRLAELLADRRRMVGYEEQYAAAAAVLLRVAQIPTRVVVGYLVPDRRGRTVAPTCTPATSPRGSRSTSTARLGARRRHPAAHQDADGRSTGHRDARCRRPRSRRRHRRSRRTSRSSCPIVTTTTTRTSRSR